MSVLASAQTCSQRHDGAERPARAPVRPPRTAADVLAVVGAQIAAVHGDRDLSTADKARLLPPLATAALKAIFMSNLESRVQALEEVLTARRTDP